LRAQEPEQRHGGDSVSFGREKILRGKRRRVELARPPVMADISAPSSEQEIRVSADALKKAEEYVEQEEGAHNKLRGALGTFVTAIAVIMSIFHLYAAYGIMPTHVLRGIHVAFVLFLCFVLYPVTKRFRNRVRGWDWVAAILSLVTIGYMLAGGDDFLERAISPDKWDEALG